MKLPAICLLTAVSMAPTLPAQDWAIEFVDGRLVVPHHDIMLGVGTRATIEAWVRAETPGRNTIFRRYVGGREHRDIAISRLGAFEFEYAGSPWAHGQKTRDGVFLFDGKWHHVAFVRHASGKYEFYVDGRTVHAAGPGPCWSTCNIISTRTPTIIGETITPWCMAALRVSSTDRYDGPFTPSRSWSSDSSTAMLMHMNEGRGATTRDSGPAGLVGALSGSYRWVRSFLDRPDPVQSLVSVEPRLITACGGTATITVIPKKKHRTMPPGQAVAVKTTGGTLDEAGVVDNRDGTYSIELTASSAATGATITATVNSVPLQAMPTVRFVPIDPERSTVDISVPSTLLDGIAIVTVKPIDCAGNPVDGSWNVRLQTDDKTTLIGSMSYVGNGCYRQKVAAAAHGTSEITAMVNDLGLNERATLAVLDPSSLGSVIGLEADATTTHAYASVQDAVNSITADALVRILVSPGSYDERVECETGNIVIEGLSATSPTTIRSLEVEECSNVTVRYLTLDAGGKGGEALEVEKATNAAFVCCTFTGTRKAKEGVEVKKSTGVSFTDCLIRRNGGDGIEIKHDSSVTIKDCRIESNGRNGVRIDKRAQVTIRESTIRDNGTEGKDRKGYGIYLKRHEHNDPTRVTLTNNTLSGNRGRVVPGRSTAELANHDQILDPSDSQTSY